MSSPPESPVFLIGLPGAGKSSVGRALARRLRVPFVDLDERIAAGAGMTIPRIFAREGEAGFRHREERALREVLADASPRVVACGGGIVNREVNRRRLARAGVVLWLDVSLPVARQRVGARPGERPLAAVLVRRPRQLARRLEHYAALGRRVAADGPLATVVRAAAAKLAEARHARS